MNNKDKSVSVCIATNPLFRLDIINSLTGGDINELNNFTEIICLQKTIGIICSKKQPDNQLNIKFKFKFKENKRSAEIMKTFINDYQMAFNEQPKQVDALLIAESFIDHMKNTYIDIIGEQSIRSIIKELYCVCDDRQIRFKHTEELYLDYITGNDNILNMFYTVWKYFIIARICELSGTYRQLKGVTVNTDYIHYNDEVCIEIILYKDTNYRENIRNIFTTLLSRLGLFYVMYRMLSDINIIVGVHELEQENGVNILNLLGFEPDKHNSRIDSYGYILPICSKENFELRNCIGLSDYTVLFDTPSRWKDEVSSKILIDLGNYIIKCSSNDDELRNVAFENEDSTYKIYTPEWFDDNTSEQLDKHFNKLFRRLLDDSENMDANCFCNDIMINDMGYSLSNFVFNVYSIGNSNFNINLYPLDFSINIGINENTDITIRDIFSREDVKFDTTTPKSVEGLYKPSKLVSYLRDNGSSNVPQNKMNFEAIKFEIDGNNNSDLQKFLKNSVPSDNSSLVNNKSCNLNSIQETRNNTLAYCSQVNDIIDNIGDIEDILKQLQSTNSSIDIATINNGHLKILNFLFEELFNILIGHENSEDKFNMFTNLLLSDIDDNIILKLNTRKVKDLINSYDFQDVINNILLGDKIEQEIDYQIKTKVNFQNITDYIKTIGMLLRDELRTFVSSDMDVIRRCNGEYNLGQGEKIKSIDEFLQWIQKQIYNNEKQSFNKVKRPIRKIRV